MLALGTMCKLRNVRLCMFCIGNSIPDRLANTPVDSSGHFGRVQDVFGRLQTLSARFALNHFT